MSTGSNGDREAARFSGRVRRYARVGTSVGGLAARLAGERLFGFALDRRAHAEDLRQALGGLKGPLMKVAQILSTIPDALPTEYAQELAHLQADAPAMGWPFVKRRMTAELGPDWRQRFGHFSREAVAAASLGQVHRAATLDGRLLACKLQYPDMSSAVEADLRQLKLIFSVYRRYDGAIDPSQIHAELSARLREELDYGLEGRNLALYRLMLADEEGVSVPEWLPELSTARLLTMTWLEGRRMLEMKDAPQDVRDRIAMNMFRAWYVPFYDYGVIHGDPHLGNYSVREDQGINLLDFGSIRIFHPRFVKGVIDLYHALKTDDEELAVSAYEAWGLPQSGPRRAGRTAPVGGVPVCPLAGRPQPPHSGKRNRGLWAPGRAQGPSGTEASGRRHPATRIRADGPGCHRPGIGVPAPEGRNQLAQAV